MADRFKTRVKRNGVRILVENLRTGEIKFVGYKVPYEYNFPSEGSNRMA